MVFWDTLPSSVIVPTWTKISKYFRLDVLCHVSPKVGDLFLGEVAMVFFWDISDLFAF